ncbi:hypothetical protein [Dishui Lake large algae virus 1]|nr:hypothetical protein [Dishui Lake large algae virus 1]
MVNIFKKIASAIKKAVTTVSCAFSGNCNSGGGGGGGGSAPPPRVFPTKPYLTDFSGEDINNIQGVVNNSCTIYYTPYTRECNKGLFTANSNVLKRMYGSDKKSYDMIMNERKNLPEPGICKISLNNWKMGSNAPIMNAVDPTNTNRGAPSTWAYCFQEVGNQNQLDSIKTKMSNSKSVNVASNIIKNVYGSNEQTGYARISFSNLAYTDIKSDVCTKLKNIGTNITIPTEMIGFTVNENDNTVSKIGIYNYNNNKIEEVVKYSSVNKEAVDKIYGKLFEDKLVVSKTDSNLYDLVLQPKTVYANIITFDVDACGENNNVGIMTGVFNIIDFYVNSNIPLLQSVKKEDIAYGLLTELEDKRQKLLNDISVIEEENRKQVTGWRCFDDVLTPIRRNEKGDIECISTDSINCKWVVNKTECEDIVRDPPVPSELKPLVCGAKYKELYGFTGYDQPKNWCAIGKKNINNTNNTSTLRSKLNDLNSKISSANNTKYSNITKEINSIRLVKVPYREGAELKKIGGKIGIPLSLQSSDKRIYIQLL